MFFDLQIIKEFDELCKCNSLAMFERPENARLFAFVTKKKLPYNILKLLGMCCCVMFTLKLSHLSFFSDMCV